MNRIRIVSGGTQATTKIFDENGQPMTSVRSITINPIKAHDGLVTATLEFINVELDIKASCGDDDAEEESRVT